MQGIKLFRLARAVGISQYRMAAVLGITRAHTSEWARGKKRIPDAHLVTILSLVGHAADAALSAIDASPDSLDEAFTGARARASMAITTLCEDVHMELLEDIGAGPSAMVAGSLDCLSKYTGMTPEELRKGTTPAELTLALKLALKAATLMERLEPIQRVLERESSRTVAR